MEIPFDIYVREYGTDLPIVTLTMGLSKKQVHDEHESENEPMANEEEGDDKSELSSQQL